MKSDQLLFADLKLLKTI